MFRDVITHALKMDGCQVIAAASGEEALEVLKKRLPHLIVLDMIMPGMRGGELLKVIKTDPRTTNIPVIMISASITSSAAHEALALDAQVLLSKTKFSMMEFRRLVKGFLLRPSASAA